MMNDQARSEGRRRSFEDLAEQLVCLRCVPETRPALGRVITVPGRNRDAFNTQPHRVSKEISHFLRILAVKECAVDGDAEALVAREPDCRYRLVKKPLLAH